MKVKSLNKIQQNNYGTYVVSWTTLPKECYLSRKNEQIFDHMLS